MRDQTWLRERLKCLRSAAVESKAKPVLRLWWRAWRRRRNLEWKGAELVKCKHETSEIENGLGRVGWREKRDGRERAKSGRAEGEKGQAFMSFTEQEEVKGFWYYKETLIFCIS